MINDSSPAVGIMANKTILDASLPPIPDFTLTPQPDLISWLPDVILSIVAPVIVYWVVSLVFHFFDVNDLFPEYRLHTPDEITRRNHATRYEVARDVVVQQIIQAVTGYLLAIAEPIEMIGKDEHNVAVWATRLRLAQRALPSILGLLGLNADAISKNMSSAHPLLAGALAGGHYPFLTTGEEGPTFAAWELLGAKFIYYLLIPAAQFICGIILLDTWQYFLHRLMHVNKFLYAHFHSRHHRLYVPYAYGALYNHPVEGFLLDTLGAGVSFKVTGMTLRQGILFFCFSTIKTVDDHCGYSFPWDPLQLITSNNAAYHDIHHQHWGIKTNFAQPFFTFWDTLLGTKYEGHRVNRIIEKKRQAQGKSQAAKSK